VENCLSIQEQNSEEGYLFRAETHDEQMEWFNLFKYWRAPQKIKGNLSQIDTIKLSRIVLAMSKVGEEVWIITSDNVIVMKSKGYQTVKKILLSVNKHNKSSNTASICVYVNFVWVAVNNTIYCIDKKEYTIVQKVKYRQLVAGLIGLQNQLWVLGLNTLTVYSIPVVEKLKTFSSGLPSEGTKGCSHFNQGGNKIVRLVNTLWIVGSDNRIRVYDVLRKECIKEVEHIHTKPINALLLWNNSVWSASNDNSICIWI